MTYASVLARCWEVTNVFGENHAQEKKILYSELNGSGEVHFAWHAGERDGVRRDGNQCVDLYSGLINVRLVI